MSATCRTPESVKEALKSKPTVWVDDTVFVRTGRLVVATHIAQNGLQCALIDNRWVYTTPRIEDGGYNAVGGINLPPVPIDQEKVEAAYQAAAS